MLDHVSIPVADLARAAAFYDAVLATLGLERRKERPGAIGYGPPERRAPVFWLLAREDGAGVLRPASPAASAGALRPALPAASAGALRPALPAASTGALRPALPAASAGAGLHVSFQAPDRPSVDAFFEVALRRGGRDAGAPGLRPQYTAPFYGAFVLDLDGFKIEAVCRGEA